MEKMDKTVRFSIILVCYFIVKSFSFLILNQGYACFSLTELQFVFHTGKDGRDGINGDVAIF